MESVKRVVSFAVLILMLVCAVLSFASCQFFIVHEDSEFLDGNYAAFGYVVSGMEIVDKICTEAKPTVAERDPVEPRQKRLFSALLTESILAILSMVASSLSQNHLKISVFGARNFRRVNLVLIKAKKRRQLKNFQVFLTQSKTGFTV